MTLDTSNTQQPNELPPKDSEQSKLARLHIWQVQALRDVLVIAVIVGVIWAGYALRFVTVPLLLAFALAYLVEPLVVWFCRVTRFSRQVAVSSILALCGLLLAIAGFVFVPTVIRQSTDFVDNFRSGRFDLWVNRVEEVLPGEYRQEVVRWRSWMSGAAPLAAAPTTTASDPPVVVAETAAPSAPFAHGPQPTESTDDKTASIAKVLVNPAAYSAFFKLLDFSSLLFAAVLIPFYFWFFSISFPSAIAFIGELIPKTRKEKIFRLAAEMDAAVAGFVRGRILIAAAMGVMFAIGWAINGVPYALTLGVLAGILSIVPYLGIVVVIPAIGLLATTQLDADASQRMAWYWIIGGPTLIFVVVQSIEGYILTPIFAGRATNLGPVSIFVAVLAGASVAGLYGMLLAIPVAACVKIAIRETVMPSLRSWAAGDSSDPLPLNRG